MRTLCNTYERSREGAYTDPSFAFMDSTTAVAMSAFIVSLSSSLRAMNKSIKTNIGYTVPCLLGRPFFVVGYSGRPLPMTSVHIGGMSKSSMKRDTERIVQAEYERQLLLSEQRRIARAERKKAQEKLVEVDDSVVV